MKLSVAHEPLFVDLLTADAASLGDRFCCGSSHVGGQLGEALLRSPICDTFHIEHCEGERGVIIALVACKLRHLGAVFTEISTILVGMTGFDTVCSFLQLADVISTNEYYVRDKVVRFETKK